MNILRRLMIVLLNASANPLAQGYKQLTPHSELVLIAEPIERLTCELRIIVVDDPSRDTKSVDDMMSDEVDHVGGFNLSERDNFCLF